MFVSAATLFALAGMVAAAPMTATNYKQPSDCEPATTELPTTTLPTTTEVPTSTRLPIPSHTPACADGAYPNGTYSDNGCGTIINPGTSYVCLQTQWDTKEHSPVYFGECFSGRTHGGRWSLYPGLTQIENKQAKLDNFCLSANANYTGLEMSECRGEDRQVWDFTEGGSTLKLAYKDLCVAVYGNLTKPDRPLHTIPQPLPATLTLEPCVEGKVNQNFTVLGPYN